MFLVGVRRHVLALSVASVVCLFGHSYLSGQDAKPKSDEPEATDSAKEKVKPSKDQGDQVDPLWLAALRHISPIENYRSRLQNPNGRSVEIRRHRAPPHLRERKSRRT